jgi:outer membrane autotransporter protein
MGGTLGIGGSWLQTGAGLYETGQNLDASVAIKRVDGPLFLAGALGVSTSSTTYNLSGNSSVYIPGAPNTFTASLRLRGAYEFPFEGWYLRPRTDVDIGYARTSGLQIVAPTATLTIDGASKTTVVLTPALEVGGRFDVGPGKILRPYVIAGATILTDTSIPFSGNFNGFSFNGTSYRTPVIARVEAGLQFYGVKDWEVKMEYLLSAADAYLDQSLGLRVARHF